MGFEERRHGPSMDRPAVVVTAALLGCFIVLLLGTPFLWQAEVRWKQARLTSNQQRNSARRSVRPLPMAEASKMRFHRIDAPPAPPLDAEVDPSALISKSVTLMISLDRSGNILADGEPRTLGDLRAMLHVASLGTSGDIKAVLAVDGRCPLECITTVREICADEGAEVTQVRESAISVDLTPPQYDSVVDTTGSQA